LTIVSLPIGNLKDITLRAIETLEQSDIIYCEDTRTTIKLTNHYNIKATLKSYHEHSTAKTREKIINELGDGKNISLVSDAGTPLISDPGYKLIRDIKKSGFNVSSAPGVSSPVMALTLSGIPSDKFLFVGFLPTKKSSRSDYLIEISNINASIIIFESAKRINGTLMALKEILGNRKVAICRELTKKFEEIINGNISDVLKEISSRDSLKGEIVIVVSGPDASNEKDIDIELMLMDALSTMSASEASKEVSKFTNLSRKEVYNVALKLKGKNYDDS
jgi:16S rRNA (cytidine1402-2'-O)-methyltransferase